MVSDKTIHKAFRTQTKCIREFFNFHYLPKLYFGFKKTAMILAFVNFNLHVVFHFLHEFLAPTRLVEEESLEMQDKDRGQLFQGDTTKRLNLQEHNSQSIN